MFICLLYLLELTSWQYSARFSWGFHLHYKIKCLSGRQIYLEVIRLLYVCRGSVHAHTQNVIICRFLHHIAPFCNSRITAKQETLVQLSVEQKRENDQGLVRNGLSYSLPIYGSLEKPTFKGLNLSTEAIRKADRSKQQMNNSCLIKDPATDPFL